MNGQSPTPTGPWFNPIAEFLGVAYLRNAFTFDIAKPSSTARSCGLPED